MTDILLRPASDADLPEILDLNRSAFEGPDEADLVVDLLKDPDAAPLTNLVLFLGGTLAGHILLSRGWLEGQPDGPKLSWLAPLAIQPEFQGRGLGQVLTHAALAAASSDGQELVFLTGHPAYYPKCGFVPAGPHGFDTPHPLPDDAQPAWMVRALAPGVLERHSGKVRAVQALERPELWSA